MELSLNPFTGFGLLDPVIEHVSAKDIQQRGHDFDRELWDKQSAFAVDQFQREADFTTNMQQRQYDFNQRSIHDSPKSLTAGLRAAGLNPILAATGGFKSNAPGVQAGSAKATAGSPSRGGSPGGAKSNVALAHKYGSLIESEVELNTAKAEAERARAGLQKTTTDIAEPVAKLMQAVAGLLEQANVDRKTTTRVWKWLASEIPDTTKPLTRKQQVEMLEKAKKRFPELQGVDNAKRKIFGGK